MLLISLAFNFCIVYIYKKSQISLLNGQSNCHSRLNACKKAERLIEN